MFSPFLQRIKLLNDNIIIMLEQIIIGMHIKIRHDF